MSIAISSKLTRTLYKGLLRAARHMDAANLPVATEAARFTLPAGMPTAPRATCMVDVVRHQFRSAKASSSFMDVALQSLSTANARVASLSAAAAAAAATEAKPSAVSFSVGQVVRHKLHGYRAVIIGWDERCRAGAQWIASTGTARLPHGTEQPFYKCLVDVRDRPDAQISYVAQDYVELLTASATEHAHIAAGAASAAELSPCLVIHPAVTRFFSEFRVAEGFYVPTARLMESYPGDSPAPAMRTSIADSSSESDESDVEDDASRRRGGHRSGRKAVTV